MTARLVPNTLYARVASAADTGNGMDDEDKKIRDRL
jgi:hypothetical protein